MFPSTLFKITIAVFCNFGQFCELLNVLQPKVLNDTCMHWIIAIHDKILQISSSVSKFVLQWMTASWVSVPINDFFVSLYNSFYLNSLPKAWCNHCASSTATYSAINESTDKLQKWVSTLYFYSTWYGLLSSSPSSRLNLNHYWCIGTCSDWNAHWRFLCQTGGKANSKYQ